MKPASHSDQNRGVLEHQLLRRLLRLSADPSDADNITVLLNEPVDWNYFIYAAHEHRLIGLIYQRLARFREAIPDHSWTQLREGARSVADFNLGLTGKLLKLLALLEAHNIPAVPYKGPVLAQLAYGDLKLRQFTDLDLLVNKEDFYRVKELLLANGCRPGWRLTRKQELAVLRHYYNYPFVSNENRVLIEVHWEFTESFFSFAFDLAQMRKRLAVVEVLGRPVRTLALEDTLLVLCAHGSKHLWKRIGWICDIAMLIKQQPNLDWNLVVERATNLGLLRILWLGLLLADTLITVPLPPEIEARLEREPLLKSMADQILEDSLSPPKSSGSLQTALLQLKLRERMTDKLNYCFRLVVATKLVDSLFMPMGRPR